MVRRTRNALCSGLAGWAGAALSLVYPPRCAACDQWLSSPGPPSPGFCSACQVGVLALGPACPGCALPGPIAARDCSACARLRPPFASAHAALVYGGPVRDALLRLKRGGRRDVARALAPYLGSLWQRAGEGTVHPVIVAPVPLHPARLRERGFNQSQELINFTPLPAGSRSRLRIHRGLLVRLHNTPDMHDLGAFERRDRVAGAFTVAAPARVAGQTVVLVDDVMTTGATFAEAARTLLAAGAEAVHVVALARALA